MNAALRQTSTLAIVSLVSGILGWTFAPLLGSIAAVICGHMARAEIRRSPERLDGDGFAIGGLILGWTQIVLSLLFLVLLFLFFGGLAAFLAWLATNQPGTIST